MARPAVSSIGMTETFDDPGEYEDEEAAMPYEPDEAAAQSAVGAVASRYEQELLGIDGVEGIAVGADSAGRDAIVVYIRDGGIAEQLPRMIDDYPVEAVVTGQISAY